MVGFRICIWGTIRNIGCFKSSPDVRYFTGPSCISLRCPVRFKHLYWISSQNDLQKIKKISRKHTKTAGEKKKIYFINFKSWLVTPRHCFLEKTYAEKCGGSFLHATKRLKPNATNSGLSSSPKFLQCAQAALSIWATMGNCLQTRVIRLSASMSFLKKETCVEY